LVLHGAGRLGRKVLAGLRTLGRPPVAFSDSAAALWGTEVDGVPVLAPEEAVRSFGGAAFVVTVFIGTREVRGRLESLGANPVLGFHPLFFKHPELFLPHYAYDLPRRVLEARELVRRAYELLEDE